MEEIVLHNKTFRLYIDHATIEKRIRTIGKQINKDFKGQQPLFIGVLDGSFMFAGELMTHVTITCEITFIKMRSYDGMTNGTTKKLIGLDNAIQGRNIVVIEDIVDTGNTLYQLLDELNKKQPGSISIVSLLSKPEALKHTIKIDYIGFEIPNAFVVGYGLDYDGLGRNLTGIYQVME